MDFLDSEENQEIQALMVKEVSMCFVVSKHKIFALFHSHEKNPVLSGFISAHFQIRL